MNQRLGDKHEEFSQHVEKNVRGKTKEETKKKKKKREKIKDMDTDIEQKVQAEGLWVFPWYSPESKT